MAINRYCKTCRLIAPQSSLCPREDCPKLTVVFDDNQPPSLPPEVIRQLGIKWACDRCGLRQPFGMIVPCGVGETNGPCEQYQCDHNWNRIEAPEAEKGDKMRNLTAPFITCTACGRTGETMRDFRGCVKVTCTNGGVFDRGVRAEDAHPSAGLSPADPGTYARLKKAEQAVVDLRREIETCDHQWSMTRDEFTVVQVDNSASYLAAAGSMDRAERYAKVTERKCSLCGLRQRTTRFGPTEPDAFVNI